MMSNDTSKYFNILVTSLNYIIILIVSKLFSDLCLAKFLDIFSKIIFSMYFPLIFVVILFHTCLHIVLDNN